ncbi:hypothetical protein DXG01_015753 [Tephrocybe rancida]|nr:hypothetical protein DXG01_015753 [Tephrocybe rancida]
MDFLKKILKSTTHYPIVVAQYERNDFSVNNPEQLHWAIVIIKDAQKQSGPTWQATDVYYRDGRFEWKLSTIDNVTLGGTAKCLGGVCVGYIGVDELDEFGMLISSNHPTAKFAGWNCRDWVIEVIDMLHNRGWVGHQISEQANLFPAMHGAGTKTLERHAKGDRRVKVLLLGKSS